MEYKKVSDLRVFELVFYLVLSWLLLLVWQRYFETVVYIDLKLNEKDSFDNFLIAFVYSGIFIAVVIVVTNFVNDTENNPNVQIPPINLNFTPSNNENENIMEKYSFLTKEMSPEDFMNSL